jgi:hypothetical protein
VENAVHSGIPPYPAPLPGPRGRPANPGEPEGELGGRNHDPLMADLPHHFRRWKTAGSGPVT